LKRRAADGVGKIASGPAGHLDGIESSADSNSALKIGLDTVGGITVIRDDGRFPHAHPVTLAKPQEDALSKGGRSVGNPKSIPEREPEPEERDFHYEPA
jgi:hypothetical protein